MKFQKRGLILAFTVATLCLFGSVFSASAFNSISMNFAENAGNQVFSGGQMIGPFAMDSSNWNSSIDRDSGSLATGAQSALIDGTGAATAASVTWASANVWYNGSGVGSDEAKLTVGYLDDGGGGGSFTVTGIPYPNYDVYILMTQGGANGNYTHNGMVVNGTNTGQLPAHKQVVDGTGWVEADGTANGNYVLITGLSGDLIVASNGNPGGGPRAPLTGFQIVNANRLEAAFSNPLAGGKLPVGVAATLAVTVINHGVRTPTSVEFFVDGISFGTDASAPFEAVFTPPAAQGYALSAIATDDIGGKWAASVSAAGFVDYSAFDVTGGGGTVIANSHDVINGHLAANAFDETSAFWTYTKKAPDYIGFQLYAPASIDSYSYEGRNGNQTARSMKDWTFEGSFDGYNWVVLDTQTAATPGPKVVYPLSTPSPAYGWYRFNCTAGGSDLIHCAEAELLSNGVDLTTGGDGVAGVAISGTEDTGYWNENNNQAWDDNAGSPWASSNMLPGYIGFEMNTAATINAYTIEGAGNAPTAWTLEGCQADGNWIELDNRTGQSIASGQTVLYELDADTELFKTYRIYMTSGPNDPRVAEIQFLDLAMEGSVAFTAPATGTIVSAGTVVKLTVLPEGFPGTVNSVEFFAGPLSIGQATQDAGAETWSFDWTPQNVGNQEIAVIAKDDLGTLRTAKDGVTVKVPLYASQAGTAGGDGTSWAKAVTLEEAQVLVDATSKGGMLMLKEGAYAPAATVAFGTNQPLEIYGGCAGTEVTPSDRTADYKTAHSATISGSSAHKILSFSSNALVLDGLTLSNGTDPGVGGAFNMGGGTLTMVNCIVSDNSNTGWSADGGAVSAGSADVTMTGCDFTNNQVLKDWMWGGAITVGSLTASDCTFTNNHTDDANCRGGALYSYGALDLSRCTFTGNISADRGGAIGGTPNALWNIDACVFTGNQGAGAGGAIWHDNGQNIITNSLFANNTNVKGATTYIEDGAIHYWNADLVVFNCTFYGNTAGSPAEAASAAAIWMGGTDAWIVNSIFAGHAGVTINHNVVDTWTPGILSITDCVFQNQTAGENTIFYGTITTYNEARNATYDPAFVNAAGGNFDLLATSEAVNTGSAVALDTDAGLIPVPTRDVAGRYRADGSPDIGAYELATKSMSITPDPLAFGTVLETETSTLTLKVQAVGSLPIDLTDVVVTGTGYSIVSLPTGSVIPFTPTEVVVEFAPETKGYRLDYAGTITASSSDAANSPITGDLTATGAPSHLNIPQPTVTIAKSDTTPTPTASTPIEFDVEFSLGVTGFEASDIDWGATTLPATSFTVTLTQMDTAGALYNLSVTDIDARGSAQTFTPTVPGGVASNAGRSDNLASTGSPSVVYDPALVGVSIWTGDGPITAQTTVNYRLTFTEAVNGFDLALLGLTGTATDATIDSVLVINQSTTYDISVLTGAVDGALTLTLNDDDSIASVATPANTLNAAGSAALAGNSILVDKTAPTVISIETFDPANPYTDAKSVVFKITFTDAVTGVDAADTSATLAGVTVSPDLYGFSDTWYVFCNANDQYGQLGLTIDDAATIINGTGVSYTPSTPDPNETYFLNMSPAAVSNWMLYE